MADSFSNSYDSDESLNIYENLDHKVFEYIDMYP